MLGEVIKDLKLESNTGKEFDIKDYKGKRVVLYFYPKDDTSGCTLEAQEFTKFLPEFEVLNCKVFGISKDSIKKHCKFVEKYDLKVELLSDEDSSVCEKFGVFVEKSMYGKKYMGIDRSTFIIDENSKVVKVWNKVKVQGHVEEVLEALRQM